MKLRITYSIFIFLFYINTFAQNLDPDKLITQYIKTTWTSSQGLLSDTVVDIMQDKNGFILIGTYDGLLRFDGIKFEVINKYTNPDFQSVSARILLEDKNGDLWVGTNGDGVAFFHNKKVTMLTTKNGLPDDSIRSLCEDKTGRIWIGTTKGICFFENGKVTKIYNRFIDNNLITFISCDKNGDIWTATSEKGIYKYENGNFRLYEKYKEMNSYIFTALYSDTDGTYWFATKDSGVIRLKNNEITLFNTKIKGFKADKINSIYKDDTGTMWFSTDNGVIRYYKNKFLTYNEDDGLINNIVEKIIQDREGNIWIATSRGGIEKLSAGKFLNITEANGLSHNTINAITQNNNGDMWIGTDSGLSIYSDNFIIQNYITDYFKNIRIRNIYKDRKGAMWVSTYSDKGAVCVKNGSFYSYTKNNGLSGNRVRVIYTDSENKTWIGTTNGLNVIDTSGNIKSYKRDDGLNNDFIMCIYENINKDIWVGTDGGGINIIDKYGNISILSTSEGLAGNVIFKIYKDKDGITWISTGSGVTRYDSGKITNYNVGTGFINDSVFELIEDGKGKFWMTTSKGVFFVSKFDMNAYAKGNISKLKVTTYDKNDGLNSGITATSWSNVDNEGKIWFPTLNGVAVIDPSNIIINNYPPLISIKEVILDDGKVTPDNDIIINPGNKRFTVNFTALSFSVPEKVLFKYKLDGFDKDFSEALPVRSATYTNISPGTYNFLVKAANNDGIWTTHEKAITIVQKPKFYQNIWFYVIIIFLIIICIYFTYKIRTRQLKVRQEELEELVRVRTEDLVKEKEKSEELLLNILPSPIAERLKKGENTIADTFIDVTILFADIVNFTQFSSQISASKLVYYLNSIFCEFDQLTCKYGIEKIKTIGDAYMAVSGLPEKREDHADVIARLSIDMFSVLESINKKMGIDLKMRIGINSGSVIAGVIGKKKFIYDLWGDAVNVASRMEHYGEADKIHVSETTYNLISKNYIFEDRGNIEIKGKGSMKTYYLKV